MVDLLWLFGSIVLIAAVITRLVFGRERRTAYAEPDQDALSWKGKE